MTVVGVVSDTHLWRPGATLPLALEHGLVEAGVSMILHCGDHTTAIAAELLERIAPVQAVAGNNDGPEIASRWGYRRVVEVEAIRIGLVHGDAGRGRTTPQRAANAFAAEPVDVVCFGHSHQPLIERQGAVLLVNPGSPTDKRREPSFSYALLRVDGRNTTAELHTFSRC